MCKKILIALVLLFALSFNGSAFKTTIGSAKEDKMPQSFSGSMSKFDDPFKADYSDEGILRAGPGIPDGPDGPSTGEKDPVPVGDAIGWISGFALLYAFYKRKMK